MKWKVSNKGRRWDSPPYFITKSAMNIGEKRVPFYDVYYKTDRPEGNLANKHSLKEAKQVVEEHATGVKES